nr:MAG TPA: hypothetical protein [Caudoviricetes sp.]
MKYSTTKVSKLHRRKKFSEVLVVWKKLLPLQ